MRTNPVGWFEIYVDDLDRATKGIPLKDLTIAMKRQ